MHDIKLTCFQRISFSHFYPFFQRNYNTEYTPQKKVWRSSLHFLHGFSVTCDEIGLAVIVAEPGPQEALGEGDEGHNGPVVGQGHQAQ